MAYGKPNPKKGRARSRFKLRPKAAPPPRGKNKVETLAQKVKRAKARKSGYR
jgi:hypothetical protein